MARTESQGVPERLRIHFNLHRRAFSVVDPATRLVIAHVRFAELRNARFRVQPAGRERCVRTGSRQVHAYVIGEPVWLGDDPVSVEGWQRIAYNPFRAATFTTEDGTPVHDAIRVRFADASCFVPTTEITKPVRSAR